MATQKHFKGLNIWNNPSMNYAPTSLSQPEMQDEDAREECLTSTRE